MFGIVYNNGFLDEFQSFPWSIYGVSTINDQLVSFAVLLKGLPI